MREVEVNFGYVEGRQPIRKIRLSRCLWKQIKEQARRRGITRHQYVQLALTMFLDQERMEGTQPRIHRIGMSVWRIERIELNQLPDHTSGSHTR